MSVSLHRSFRFVVAILALYFGVANQAIASGFGAPRMDGSWSSPTFATPASMRFNPSILNHLDGFQLEGGLALIYAHAGYERQRRASYQRADGLDFKLPVAPSDVDPSRSGWQPEVTGGVLLPGGSGAISLKINDRWALGGHLYPELGAVLTFADQGPHQWQLQQVTLLATSAGASVAFKALPWLDLGFGVDLMAGLLSLRQVADLAQAPLMQQALGEPPINQVNDFGPSAPAGVRELDVLSRPVTIRNAQAMGWTWRAGLTAQIGAGWLAALGWRHQTDLVFVGDAYLDMNHDLFTQDLTSQGLQYPALVKGRAYVPLPVPSVLHVGLGGPIGERFALHAHIAWNRYSVVKTLDVTLQSQDLTQPKLGLGDTAALSLERDWIDTVEAEVLASVDLSRRLKLGWRVGYHSPMSPDA
ncbi:MAG TPA: hypothetical protein DCQ06_06045, partial [Myxococcales bacterium]|nr:hypothetical protein [Myxococcales bacterium]